MKIILDNNDIETIYNYAIYSLNNPCKYCNDKIFCCGCPKGDTYKENNKSIIDKYNLLCSGIDSLLVNKYVQLTESLIASFNTFINAYNTYHDNVKNIKIASEQLFEYVSNHININNLIIGSDDTDV